MSLYTYIQSHLDNYVTVEIIILYSRVSIVYILHYLTVRVYITLEVVKCLYRAKTTDIALKECSAYGPVDQGWC